MTGNIFRAGSAYLEEMMELVETGSLTVEETSAILAQVDLLCQQASHLKPTGHSLPYCRILAQLCRHEQIDRMITAGANPRLIRALRNRRARTYALYLGKMSEKCEGKLQKAARVARESGEWMAYIRIQLRRPCLEWSLFRLRAAGRAYLAGFRVQIAPICRKVKLLLE